MLRVSVLAQSPRSASQRPHVWPCPSENPVAVASPTHCWIASVVPGAIRRVSFRLVQIDDRGGSAASPGREVCPWNRSRDSVMVRSRLSAATALSPLLMATPCPRAVPIHQIPELLEVEQRRRQTGRGGERETGRRGDRLRTRPVAPSPRRPV